MVCAEVKVIERASAEIANWYCMTEVEFRMERGRFCEVTLRKYVGGRKNDT